MTASWVTMDESPVVSAVHTVLDQLAVSGISKEPVNPGDYVHWQTIPINNIEYLLAFFGIPSGTFLGEKFQRRIYKDLFELFQYRNYRVALEAFARDAQIAYTITFEYTGGLKTGMEICISESPLGIDLTTYLVGVTEWLRWLMEWWAASLTVITCQTTSVEINLTIKSIAHQIYPLTIFDPE